mmetsp:Transcript_25336/g.74834  ORF Transcript_25336/g.74834 Transcript_25336/m.74834 type:complete len:84 (-) Transcript_25336:189-440(-)|eukprot:363250-Chlamydomonas_euryale.AAC.5
MSTLRVRLRSGSDAVGLGGLDGGGGRAPASGDTAAGCIAARDGKGAVMLILMQGRLSRSLFALRNAARDTTASLHALPSSARR